ncbi:uncharacterized protein LOC128807822 [Vidua macroura]|uniref:uncharacterized protein LOC128807822 n=1 Tax=Vidua macroura TaxID=187451 RepID=UPI0023A8E06C|nr:uncharacterized protein LOC128807822 [Vidua macroura]
MKEGKFAVATACPVIYVPNQHPAYRELDYKVIKELGMLLKESALSSHHALTYLESISTTYVLTPHDWKSIMKIIPTAAQFAVWLTDYRELCTAQVLQDRNSPIATAQLSRENASAVPAAQAAYPHDILQDPAESFMQLLDRLHATLSRQVNNDEARTILWQQLAFINTNEDCRKAVLAVHNPHICDVCDTFADMVRACRNVGTAAYN